MKAKSKSIKWWIVFTTVFLLTQINSIYPLSAAPFFLGFPTWLFYLVLIHLIFLVALYFFVNDESIGESNFNNLD